MMTFQYWLCEEKIDVGRSWDFKGQSLHLCICIEQVDKNVSSSTIFSVIFILAWDDPRIVVCDPK